MKRKMAMLALSTIVALGCIGCGGNSDGDEQKPAETEQKEQTENSGKTDSSADNTTSEKPYAGQTVRVTSWGGTYEETLRNIVKPAFEERTGATLEIVLGSAPLAQLKAEGDDPSVDVLHVNYYEMMNGKLLGVTKELDYDSMSNAPDLYDEAKENEYGVITNWGTRGFAYRNDLIDAPTSWKDLWNPEYAGKVIVSDVTFGGGYELAEMAAHAFFDSSLTDKSCWDGVFEKLEELAPNVYMVSTQHSDTDTALINGDAVIAIHTNGRTAMLSNDGHDDISYADLEEGLPGMPTYVAVAKNTKVPELANELVNELIGVEAEYAYATNNFYAPSNKKCEVPKELQPFMPYGEEAIQKLIFFDQEMITEEDRAEFVDRWNKVFKN